MTTKPLITFKEGVTVSGVWPLLFDAIIITADVYALHGKELVVTSISDGTHSVNSFHYKGRAFDCRTRYFTKDEQKDVVSDLKSALGDDFDVVLESDHIHVEYDPD